MSAMIEQYVEVSDGLGGRRLELRAVPAPAKKGKAPQPDPIQSPTQVIVKSDGGEVVAADLLRQLIERVERLEEEKRGIMEDIKEVFSEAKAQGFDVLTMRKIIKMRGMEKHKRDEAEALFETYAAALGMVG